ncbi:MAG: endonuclease/exonuclease/phosphatase family protein [Treponema sp.]|jgi:endonuclease/exonuclease/phosphatase family metal-dependent hydrolase|nr:endonuclease/exonuclease/phosphatase family protein [Treponema sp.]
MTLNVLCYNLRTPKDRDGPNHWQYRADAAAQLFSVEDIDIAGLQEASVGQVSDLRSRLPGYCLVGTGGGNEDGLECPVIYKKDRFRMRDSGVFWLSETPEVPASRSWDTRYPRTAAWVILEEQAGGGSVCFVNTHLDHRGPEAREKGAAVLLKEMARLRRGLDTVLTGDFNTTPETRAIQDIVSPTDPNQLVYAKETARRASGPDYTFSSYGALAMDKRITIDFIFVSRTVDVLSYDVLPDTLGGVYLSDHNPIKALVRLSGKGGQDENA